MGFETYGVFVIPTLALTLCSTLLVFFYIWTKYKERVKIIEKGDFAFETNYLKNLKYSVLSKGILFTTLSIGLAVAYIITKDVYGADIIPVYLICLLGSGGISMLVYYFIIRKDD